MQFYLKICCLFVSYYFILFASGAKVSCNSGKDVANNITKNNVTGENRWKLEEAVFEKGLQMANDKGELIELTTDVIPPKGSASRTFHEKPKFLLYTRKNRKRPQEIIIDYRSLENLKASNFNPHRPTVFITHGWVNNGSSPSCTLIRDAYLKEHDMNVIVIDWSSTSFASYLWAARQVKRIGIRVAEMIDYLASKHALRTEETTLVGHSLGAHVVGIAAFHAKGKIKSVFGLDPAFPMFKFASPGSRISSKDAKHVQIIHTNGGRLGYDESIGQTDFYPNGGVTQLGCGSDLLYVCSHSRAVELFAESLNSIQGFHGRHCPSTADFMSGACHGPSVAKMGGLTVDPKMRGKFYLWTHNAPPYAAGILD